MPQLVFVDGANTNTKLTLADTLVLFNNKGSITLESQGSPQVELNSDGEKFLITNLRPELLGMAINGETLKQTVLKNGDLVLLGDSMFLYHEDEDKTQTRKQVFLDSFESRIDSRLKPYADASSVFDSFTQNVQSEQHKKLMLAYQINNLISTIFDLNSLIQEILQILFKGLNASRGFFFLRDETTKKMKIHSRCPNSKEKGQNWPETILREVLKRKESILYVYNQDEQNLLTGKSIVSASISSILAVPLVLSKKGADVKGKIIGIMQFYTITSSLTLFGENELNFLNIIGSQLAAAISQLRSFQERKQYDESLVKLSRCNQFLSAHLTKEKIIQETVKSACQLLGCTKASVVLYDSHFEHLSIEYAIGIEKKLWKSFSISSTDSLCAQVIQRQAPLLVTDHTQMSPSPNFKPNEKYQTSSFLIVPIPASVNNIRKNSELRKIIGVICATDKIGSDPFIPHEQEFLNIIATQTGIALANAELYEKATIDALTRLYVRRYFFQKLDELILESRHKKETLGLMLLDLDHFKKQNDTYGHQAGDEVLRELGSLIKSSIRDHDVPARYGGEEFAIILSQATSKDYQIIAERIRQAVEQYPFNQKHGIKIQTTISIGLTCLQEEDKSASLIKRADQNLYTAKTGGRNRVIFI
ncbi:MAG: sensor domain-containing diguanylate cyclase [Planctomycetota bacterium]